MQGLEEKIVVAARECLPLAVELLSEAIRIPADYVDLSAADGGDPSCGLSNHEGPRLEYFRRRIAELGAVDSPDDVRFDDFGNLWWTVQDPDDGVAADEKTVVYLDGHTDTVQPLRSRWQEAIGGGIDAYDGLVDAARIRYWPPRCSWTCAQRAPCLESWCIATEPWRRKTMTAAVRCSLSARNWLEPVPTAYLMR
jgi:hypothetical protein